MADTLRHSMVNTTFPVLLPELPELRMPNTEFEAYLYSALKQDTPIEETARNVTSSDKAPSAANNSQNERSSFMTGLLGLKSTRPTFDSRDGKMLTQNADVAYATTNSALVDLFHELEDAVYGPRLQKVLEQAWIEDADATLKLIWNARSIHLGKSSRNAFYRAIGWLYENHPLTLLINLPWLVRPLIRKKFPKKESNNGAPQDTVMVEKDDVDSDFEMIDEKDDFEDQPQRKRQKVDGDEVDDRSTIAEFDVKYGVSHGYWKDLLNILALAANGELKVDGNPRNVLNVTILKMRKARKLVNRNKDRDFTPGRKKTVIAERHNRIVQKLEKDSSYKALHVVVARMFAQQLSVDYHKLEAGTKRDRKTITLAAKWAPSAKGMHDEHTFVVSSIAELLYPVESVCENMEGGDRTMYLKHARQAYQLKTLSKLRKYLDIVERPISANKFEDIKYDRVPSLAMKRYTKLFIAKDTERFDKYIENVAQGKSKISGATLLPSTLVAGVAGGKSFQRSNVGLVDQKTLEMQARAVDGQWKTLVQRIKDSGTLDSSIAVCDVSGSMSWPRFSDNTCPMDSAIGLSLLLAEVTQPPFGGAFITFHTLPAVLRAGGPDDKRSFSEKVNFIRRSPWGGSTNLVAVFEDLILPMAVENKLKQEDMVKQVFIFSDMHFNGAIVQKNEWTTSYQRIEQNFAKAGYKVPKIVFWNLAGAANSSPELDSWAMHTGVAPKQVTAEVEGTALVSGYSQGQLKMFLDNGQFEDPKDEDEQVEQTDDGEQVVVEKKAQPKMTPETIMRKAISHEAYRMLKVVD